MKVFIVVACLCLFAQAIVGQEDPLTVTAPSPSFAYSGEAVGTFLGDITVKTTPTGTTVAPSIVPIPLITIVPSPLITIKPSPLITVAPFKKTATVVALTSSATSLQSFLSFLF
ncbi:uncharacterized protein ACA1_141990 [Acanthamoeba castellanii str. Neff]|uniref:Uncharacterized protein n=1 Tax=Acanthamoeba castellanii (strain ATCC 30010 / Neff) TaxID=1257118 RepID=L8HAF1_ACACF|nr:uncharacterized protein ACA1_141990 [Acanthamoeba castellanii str. Neff]ELR22509.1 hypothetical protein ACA1_141990 [Acanthamoeba castellanii str. Neff]